MVGTFWICVHLILVGILHDGDAYTKAAEGQFKYQVFVETSRSECGGAVLDKYHILIAARCVKGVNAKNIRVVAGVVNLGMPGQEIRRVEKTYIHPYYGHGFIQIFSHLFKSRNQNIQSNNDIAVMRLTEPLPLGGYITRIDLPRNDSLPYRKLAAYSGWGRTLCRCNFQIRFAIVEIMSPSTPSAMSYRKNEFYAQFYPQGDFTGFGNRGNLIVRGGILYGIASSVEYLSAFARIAFTQVSGHLDFIQNATSDVNDSDNC